MATTKKTTPKDIVSAYMKHVLETGKMPESVYAFCKQNKMKEEEFYAHFGSFTGLQKGIWKAFYDNAHAVMHKQPDFENYSNKEKLLSLFFTLFEVFKANRSYILAAIEDEEKSLKSLKQLSELRKEIKMFTGSLLDERNDASKLKIQERNKVIFSEAAWLQFLFLMRFWLDDNSAGFEKTDIAIEKSVNTVFDLFETTPLESLFDFSKFLWNERSMA
ncbi:MAG: TetR family transcriptional regulator C-terminal domain-containing protein [Flavobacteriaceae bacterium]|nr:TetR family transcriptional regulator C-terminal domain-containing protein [Flavobacteriaceae bacterium]